MLPSLPEVLFWCTETENNYPGIDFITGGSQFTHWDSTAFQLHFNMSSVTKVHFPVEMNIVPTCESLSIAIHGRHSRSSSAALYHGTEQLQTSTTSKKRVTVTYCKR